MAADKKLPDEIAPPVKSYFFADDFPPPVDPQADRVVPLLLRDVLTHTQARQALHLRLFADHLADFLEFCEDTTEEEWHMLLVLLFSFARRRGGLTPMQQKSNDEISDLCFQMIHTLLATPHGSSVVVQQAVRSLVIDKLDLTLKKAYGEDMTTMVENLPPPTVPVGDASGLPEPEDIATSDDEATPEGSEDPTIPTKAPTTVAEVPIPTNSDLPCHPYYLSVDSLDPLQRGSLTEHEFVEFESWFNSISRSAEGKLLVTEAIQTNQGVAAGIRHVSDLSMKEWMQLHPTGDASLSDVLRFFFPDVPLRTILKRVAGHPLLPPPPADKASTTQAPTMTFIPPRAEACARELMRLRAVGKDEPTVEYVSLLFSWFRSIDFRGTGLIARRGRKLCPIEVTLQKPPTNSQWQFSDVLSAAFPTADEVHLRRLRDQVIESAKLREKDQLNFCRMDDEAFERALQNAPGSPTTSTASGASPDRNMASLPASTSASPTTAEPSPLRTVHTAEDGSLITSLPSQAVDALRTLNQRLYDQYKAVWYRKMKETRKEHRRAKAAQVRAAALRAQREKDEGYQSTNVPVVYGPTLPPKELKIGGFIVREEMLHIDSFIERVEWRPMAVSLLRHVDLSGIHPQFFIEDKKKYPIHDLLLTGCWSSIAKVYRDFAFCSRRPSAKTYWEGNHVLHVKTNIPKKSDIKYRIQLEGYNFGANAPINTVCVGYAARMLTKLDEMESYGWPDGWDKYSKINFNRGIEKVSQYYSSDGFVTLRCEAKSLQAVGFSMSAWLVTHEFGAGFPIGAKVYHQQQDL